MKTFLGVDGGGSKTRFLLIEATGKVLASHASGPAYHLEIGLAGMQDMLVSGIRAILRDSGVAASGLSYAFLGLPAYGEDQALQQQFDTAPAAALPAGRYRCGNDMVCGWAGALAGADGINIVAGTGSIAYGEYAGRSARAGGWGELFSDEGSAYWIAREGLRLFSRMADGRTARGPLYEEVRRHFALEDDLQLCAAIYGKPASDRSQLAQLARLVAQAARGGDAAARELLARAVSELADLVDAVRTQLQVPAGSDLSVSNSGGVFQLGDLLLNPLQTELAQRGPNYRLLAPRLPPEAGAALYAAKLSGTPLGGDSIAVLEETLQS